MQIAGVKKAILLLLVVIAAITPMPASQQSSDGSASVSLASKDLPTDCKEVDGVYPIDIEIAILYERTSTYKAILPPLKEKRSQSFNCNGAKGTVYYFIFADEASRQHAASFIKPLLWGEAGPTKMHPELVLESNATLAVVSFRNPPEQLVKTLKAKMGIGASAVSDSDDFKLALPKHQGQLRWSAMGFKVLESSAKPNGNEIGIRAKDDSGRLAFLGFLFLVPEQAPLTSAKCRDGALEPEKKSIAKLKSSGVVEESARPGTPPVSVVSYTAKDRSGKSWYYVRAFVATGDICGDLEFYSDQPISADDTDLQAILSSYRFDEKYVPAFNDVFVYAQILYNAHMYKPAAPIFELALGKLRETPGSGTKTTMRRVVTDQAGMAYGMSGDISKARAIFERAIAEDPDYPMYYYNLACADAEEKNLVGARKHLQEAFARRANAIPGEGMPDPTKDDSFLPYRNNKDFWAFLSSLQGKE